MVLYDGLKNLLLIPVLVMIRRKKPPRGVLVAHFILWYGFLRIFIDFFREYRTDFYGFPPGQEFNMFMTLAGLALLVYFYRKGTGKSSDTLLLAINQELPGPPSQVTWYKKAVFAILLILPMTSPSDWTQDRPARYSSRHPGITYSAIYPRIVQPGDELSKEDKDQQLTGEEQKNDQKK